MVFRFRPTRAGRVFVMVTAAWLIGGYGCSSTRLSTADMSKKLSGHVNDAGTRVINVTARRYAFDPNQIVVRQGETVQMTVTSQDVTHGMDIPDYGINRRLEPHKPVVITFVADKPGVHPFHCSVFCGWGHFGMKGNLIVLPAPQRTQ